MSQLRPLDERVFRTIEKLEEPFSHRRLTDHFATELDAMGWAVRMAERDLLRKESSLSGGWWLTDQGRAVLEDLAMRWSSRATRARETRRAVLAWLDASTDPGDTVPVSSFNDDPHRWYAGRQLEGSDVAEALAYLEAQGLAITAGTAQVKYLRAGITANGRTAIVDNDGVLPPPGSPLQAIHFHTGDITNSSLAVGPNAVAGDVQVNTEAPEFAQLIELVRVLQGLGRLGPSEAAELVELESGEPGRVVGAVKRIASWTASAAGDALKATAAALAVAAIG